MGFKETHDWRGPVAAAKEAVGHAGKSVLLAQTGSRAYGTNRPDSDYDYRGVYVASAYDMLKIRDKPKQTFDIKDPDITIYELEHFAKLAADANPGILEILYAPRFAKTKLGAELRASRHVFLSKKIHAKYGGYARAQIKKAKEGTGGARGADHHKRLKFKLHTLRLLDAGIAGLRDEHIQVRHPDPEHLWKMAALDIEQLDVYVNQKMTLMDAALLDSKLPEEPDYDRINRLVYELRSNV